MQALDSCYLMGFHHLSATLQEDKEVVSVSLRKKKIKFGELSRVTASR